MYIDSHSHWSDPRIIDSQIETLLEKAQKKNITQFMLGGVDPVDWQRQMELQKKIPGRFHLCFGLHPYFVAENSAKECELALDELAQQIEKATALGEAGLDFREHILSRGGLSIEEAEAHQMEFFENQIQLAKFYQKPMVLHIVRAHEKAVQILELWGVPPRGGLVHAFNGSLDVAKKYMDLGFLISLGGAVTFEKNHKLRQAVEKIPMESIVLESDAPDQAPLNWEGMNDSSSLWQIAQVVGDIRKISTEVVLENSTQNFKKLFMV